MKDTFYFTHDYNARQDFKIKRLMRKHGALGYGVFWSIIEDLYNNENALPLDYDCMSYDYHASVEVIQSVINDFELFTFSGSEFGSVSVQNRLDVRDKKSKNARDSARKRWSKATDNQSSNANALPTDSEGNANKEREEIKEIEEIKKEKDLLAKANSQNEILTDDKSDLSNSSLESEKKEKEKTPAKKEKEKMQHWDELVEVWFQFYQSKFFEKPTFGALPGRNLKDILTLLKKDTEAKGNIWSLENSKSCFKSFLNLAYGIEWYRTHFQLKDLVSNYDSIKQSYTTTKSNERVRDYSIPL